MARLIAWLDRRATVYAASAVSLLLGLFFIFVWTPIPWGWKGIDGYDALALTLARGESFPTIHVAWGYAYFLAVFYRLFGNHPAIPLAVQALLNASIPLMLYYIVRRELNERIAVMSAVLVGVGSFNTVYVSTQAPDPMCTVIIVAAMLCFANGVHRQRIGYFVAAGTLIGISYQFRPNLVLFPAFLLALYLALHRRFPGSSARLAQMACFLAAFLAAAAPWVIRNYRWTGGLLVPATTHGGVQLWFGTLQTGPYRENWAYNPRAAFEFPPLDYTSIDELPIVVTAAVPDCDSGRRFELVYWTNRDRTPQRLPTNPGANNSIAVELPRQPTDTAVYYYFEGASGAHQTDRVKTPAAGDANPFMIVVSRNHLGDLDVDGHMLDVFDVVHMLRHVAWSEPLADAARLDLDGDGSVTTADIRRAAALIVDEHADPARVTDPTASIAYDAEAATLAFADGSTVSVPRSWSGLITDLNLHTTVVAASGAQLLVSRSRSFASLTDPGGGSPRPCLTVGEVAANRIPKRRLVHEMHRFTALSLDNIRHDPAGYLFASALRALRVFIIAGSEDQRTASQFEGAGRVYAVGRAASVLLLLLFAAGVWIAWRSGFRVYLLLGPVVYLPLTICFLLINARYSMTMQPFVFAFAAVSLVTALGAAPAREPAIDAQSR